MKVAEKASRTADWGDYHTGPTTKQDILRVKQKSGVVINYVQPQN